ncbi:MAG TPA: argininosuccinate synthase [Lachnospiraceae bacterium]|nr:argininosuccinate synthase [Lachnospiraceae bacterium]
MAKEKVVLAYSGGLDTTVIIPWLKENYDYDVIAACIDVGQGAETDGLEEKALKTGASKYYQVDVTEEFITKYIYPTLKAGAVYESSYMLGTSMARPLIAKVLVDIAKKEGAVAICHGATGKGNDQVRFELAIKALAPELKIIAPWRIWNIQSREEEIQYCIDHGITPPVKKGDSYSRDRNIWHISHEGLELEDPSNEPNYDKMLKLGVTPQKAPDVSTKISIDFEKGIPVAVNGQKLDPVSLLKKLNELGGQNGIGIVDILENRMVGMKSRGVYETPGGTILFKAHEQLEHMTLDKDTYEYKQLLAVKFADLVYCGKWFTPLRQAISAFVDSTQEHVTGTANLVLYKGNIIPAGTTSPYSLYDADIASFTTGELYSHKDAEGFINLVGLPLKIQGMKGLTKVD